MKKAKKTQLIHIRIDEATKRLLDAAAEESGITTASLVRACVKEMLRNGGAHFMLPENMRLPTELEEALRQKSLASINEELRQRRYRQMRKYMANRPLPRRSF